MTSPTRARSIGRSSAEARAQMAATGACEIPSFVRAEAHARIRRGRANALPRSRTGSGGLGTVYLGFPDESFPLDHPQQWLGQYDLGAVAYDLFPPDSPIRRFYEWPEFTRFVAAILGLDEIYPFADPLGALEPGGDDRRGSAPVALRRHRLRRVARDPERRRGRRLRGRPADSHRRRRALRRRRARPRRRTRRA